MQFIFPTHSNFPNVVNIPNKDSPNFYDSDNKFAVIWKYRINSGILSSIIMWEELYRKKTNVDSMINNAITKYFNQLHVQVY